MAKAKDITSDAAVAEKAPKVAAKPMTMEELLADSGGIHTLSVGDVVEGTVISVAKNEIWLDLGQQGTGLVSARSSRSGSSTSTARRTN
jgi:exosome complex RNA-binding protein Csl4